MVGKGVGEVDEINMKGSWEGKGGEYTNGRK